MTDLFENPMGLDGFEFVEFASPEPGVLEPLFETLGFSEVAKHRSKEVTLWRQGDINFIINSEPGSYVAYFAEEHGPCACGMAFRVADSHKAYNMALEKGAQPIDIPAGPMESTATKTAKASTTSISSLTKAWTAIPRVVVSN